MTLIDTARKYIGIKEGAGDADNATIVGWANELGIPYTADSIAWCALFMSWVAYEAGYEGLKTLRARDWLNVGAPVSDPQPGDVAVFWRVSPGGSLGHVGIYDGETNEDIIVLGGNQDDSVGIGYYPKSRLLGYRRLKKIGEKTEKKRLKPFFVIVGIPIMVVILYKLWNWIYQE